MSCKSACACIGRFSCLFFPIEKIHTNPYVIKIIFEWIDSLLFTHTFTHFQTSIQRCDKTTTEKREKIDDSFCFFVSPFLLFAFFFFLLIRLVCSLFAALKITAHRLLSVHRNIFPNDPMCLVCRHIFFKSTASEGDIDTTHTRQLSRDLNAMRDCTFDIRPRELWKRKRPKMNQELMCFFCLSSSSLSLRFSVFLLVEHVNEEWMWKENEKNREKIEKYCRFGFHVRIDHGTSTNSERPLRHSLLSCITIAFCFFSCCSACPFAVDDVHKHLLFRQCVV